MQGSALNCTYIAGKHPQGLHCHGLWALLVNKPGLAAAWWEHIVHSEVTHREELWTARYLSIACSIVDATHIHAIIN